MKDLRIITIAMLLLFSVTTLSCTRRGAGIEWDILHQEAIDLYRQGKYDRAVVVAQKALEVAEQNVGRDHPDVATGLNNLAMLYDTQGDYAKAEPLYKRSLAITEKALGRDHPDVATTLNNLAFLYNTQGDYARAEPLYKRSLAIKEKALGPDHPSVANVLNNLASLYDAQGDYARAEAINANIEKIKRMAYGFRNREHYRTAIYFHCGGLDLQPKSPPFSTVTTTC